MSDFWIVSDYKFKKHFTPESAEGERDRLRGLHPKKSYRVYRCKSNVRTRNGFGRLLRVVQRFMAAGIGDSALLHAQAVTEARTYLDMLAAEQAQRWPYTMMHKRCGMAAFFLTEKPEQGALAVSSVARLFDGSVPEKYSAIWCGSCGMALLQLDGEGKTELSSDYIVENKREASASH